MPKYVLALDQGTTSSRAILFDRKGAVCASASREFKQHYPRAGWVEHDAEEIWQSQFEVAKAALAEAQASAEDLAAIGITNQRETVVLWDRATGKPIHPAIVWQCRRTAAMCDRIRQEGFDKVIRERTGLVTDAYFSGTKIAWLLENVPCARERAERGELACGTIDSWLIWRLTGGKIHSTDVSNASRTTAFQHCDARLGQGDSQLLSNSAVIASHGEVFKRNLRRDRLVRVRGSDCRRGRRPAGITVWPPVLHARRRQEHLRHRLLPADEHRPHYSPLPGGAAGHHRLGKERPR